jgi:hypothetical protein
MLKRIHFASPMVKSEEENLILVWQKLLVACAFPCPSPLLTYPPAQDANNKIIFLHLMPNPNKPEAYLFPVNHF